MGSDRYGWVFFPTLFRDVPFSGLYWFFVEKIKIQVHVSFKTTQRFYDSLIAASSGGTIACIITHPFDVIKTRTQMVDFYGKLADSMERETSVYRTCKNVMRTQGFIGFYTGLSARLSRIVPSCTILLTFI